MPSPMYQAWASIPARMRYSEDPEQDESLPAIRRTLPPSVATVVAGINLRQQLYDFDLIRLEDGYFVKSEEYRPNMKPTADIGRYVGTRHI